MGDALIIWNEIKELAYVVAYVYLVLVVIIGIIGYIIYRKFWKD